MARAQKETRRGSPEAIAKRRAARTLNTLFAKSAVVGSMDGRTVKRKNRLMKELQQGRGGSGLKAHEALSHVTELLAMGETVGSIRKLNPRVPSAPALTAETVQVIRDTQDSYGFDPRAWKMLGVDIDAVTGNAQPSSGDAGRKKPGRKKKRG